MNGSILSCERESRVRFGSIALTLGATGGNLVQVTPRQRLDRKRDLIRHRDARAGVPIPIIMMKCRVFSLCVAVAASISLATAQVAPVRSSSTKAGADPVQNATKPLTPKSAMPPQRKSSLVTPKATSGGNTNTELTRLERQPIKAGTPKSGSAGPAKGAPVAKSTTASAAGSGINFRYQKPVGGTQASTPDALTPNSGTPRVKKH
jgi:hypothetical protein